MSNILHLLSNQVIQLMLNVNSWKVIKRMTKEYYHFVRNIRLTYILVKCFSIIIKSNMEEKNQC
jgi:hypothetical protein